MSDVHPTAIVGDKVRLGERVKISPYAVLDGEINIGDDCEIGPFVHITGLVNIGARTRILSAAAIGEPPQDLSYDGTPGLVEIGSDCVLREYVTVHTPIEGDQGKITSVGDHCFFMANSHVAHNVKVGSHVIMANGALLAGFVQVGDYAFISGNVAVHQFCRIGSYVMVGGLAKVVQDVPPFVMVDGTPAHVHGLNIVGLRRGGFDRVQRSRIKEAFKLLYSGISFKEAVKKLKEKTGDDPLIHEMIEIAENTKRGLVTYEKKA